MAGFLRSPGAVMGCALALALLLGSTDVALADDAEDAGAGEPSEVTDPGDWEFSLAAYGWLTDITGSLAAHDTRVDVDPQLWNDILRNLDGALMGTVEGRYRGRWIVNVDLFGSKLSTHVDHGPFAVDFGPRSFSRDLRAGDFTFPVETRLGTLEVPIRVDPGTLRIDVPGVETAIGPFDVDVKNLLIMSRLQVGYRVLDAPALELFGEQPSDDPRRVRIDLLAGLRYWYMKTEIDIESPPIEVPEFTVTSSLSGGAVRVGGQRIPPRTAALPTVRLPGLEFGGTTFGGTDVDESVSTWWIDPVIGARIVADLTERFSLVVAGNVGGFGIGSASQFSWEALALLDWRFGDTTSFALGYRGVGFDRPDGDAQADIVLHGPLLGLIFRF